MEEETPGWNLSSSFWEFFMFWTKQWTYFSTSTVHTGNIRCSLCITTVSTLFSIQMLVTKFVFKMSWCVVFDCFLKTSLSVSLAGNHMLLRVLPSVYLRQPDTIHCHLGNLTAMMSRLESPEQQHLIRLIQMVAEQHPLVSVCVVLYLILC